jgi:hypothetical protein
MLLVAQQAAELSVFVPALLMAQISQDGLLLQSKQRLQGPKQEGRKESHVGKLLINLCHSFLLLFSLVAIVDPLHDNEETKWHSNSTSCEMHFSACFAFTTISAITTVFAASIEST